MDILKKIDNKLILPGNIVDKETFLEKKKTEICLLLDSNDIDVIDIQNIGSKINNIKKNTMESRDIDELIEKLKNYKI